MNVGKSINCIVAMVDRLQQQEEQTVMSPEPQEGDTNSKNTGDGKSRLRVLIQTSACFCSCLCIKSFLYVLIYLKNSTFSTKLAIKKQICQLIILQKVLVDSAVQSIVTLAVSMLCVHVYLLWRRKS